jgi:cytochrome b6-f complex iron-sulfur subunit
MNRREVVQKFLVGGTALIVIPSALTSCTKDTTPDPNPKPKPGTKIDIDLTLAQNSALNTAGGSIIVQSIIVANVGGDAFVALDSICTHQGCTVEFNLAAGNFQCPCHGSVYSKTGTVINGPAPDPLKLYAVSRAGDILTVTV